MPIVNKDDPRLPHFVEIGYFTFEFMYYILSMFHPNERLEGILIKAVAFLYLD